MNLEIVKKAFKSRTVWLGIAIMILPYFQNLILGDVSLYEFGIQVVIGVAVIVLRFVTTQPISEK